MSLSMKSQTIPAISLPSADELAAEIVGALRYRFGKDRTVATSYDWLNADHPAWCATASSTSGWHSTKDAYQKRTKRVYYLSLEFLIGRLLRDAFSNLGMMDVMREALDQARRRSRYDRGAGTGCGAGQWRPWAARRLFHGEHGEPRHSGLWLRHPLRHGLFRQKIHEAGRSNCRRTGWFMAIPGNSSGANAPTRSALAERSKPQQGWTRWSTMSKWTAGRNVLAVAFDTPIVGWRGKRVNTLRLWNARPIDPIMLDQFNPGDHIGALGESNKAEALTRVLYPADRTPAGQELRLRQEYFFTSASLQDLLRRHVSQYGDLLNLAEKAAIQLNDTHPAIAIAELMRLLVDVHRLRLGRSLGHYARHLRLTPTTRCCRKRWKAGRCPCSSACCRATCRSSTRSMPSMLIERAHRTSSMVDFSFQPISLIDENGGRRVRMGNLAFVGSHSINGVSALHTD